ncbi:MAG: hypothetical protein BWK72_18535 [Rhodoferax ferrireducens]|jgi:uncharacterized protein YqiB (DUF1249 family)|uniref:DUF6908 domain-containing protein n=1 Tax=Rhodoferax ferrireducens TaxID=192843 RepID=A0A1W9KPV9_9BURK|nr:MAG: hypothetical protein BWK72_18535 [Rhodoferax ferrireducens]
MAGFNSRGDLHQRIYKKLQTVIPDLQSIDNHGKSVVLGYMDLNLDVLRRGPTKTIIALSHYYKHPSGDMIADPDMVLAVYSDRAMAEALSYQDSFGYQEVYSQGGAMVDVRAKRELNQFLMQWLSNLIVQGHRIHSPEMTVMPNGAEHE